MLKSRLLMCCTFLPARLSSTLLYAGEARWNGSYVHVLAYQNAASTAGPNAMILPLPAARIGPENAVDTRPFRTFLEDIREATRRPRMPSFGPPGPAAGAPPQVFDVGSYTVVLSASPRSVLGALSQVPESKRPAINDRMLEAFEHYYPGWPVAVCCWNGDLKPEPLLWWYEPKFPEWLFAPALDAHDGNPPDIHATVHVDHYVAFGSALTPQGQAVHYRDDAGPFRSLLPASVRGTSLFGGMSNGDFWSRIDRPGEPARRSAPGHARGELTPLNGWEGDAPPWAHTQLVAAFPPTPPELLPRGAGNPVWTPQARPGTQPCPRCGWMIDLTAKLCAMCGAPTSGAPQA